MSVNLENLIAAFESDSGRAADQVWSQIFRYLRTVSDKQGAGIANVLLKKSPSARSSVVIQLKKGQKLIPVLIQSLSGLQKSLDDGASLLLNYAIDVLLVSTDPIGVRPGDFAGLFRSLTISEFSDILAPAIARAMRRSASRSLRNVEGILECCRVDMSLSYAEIVSALLESVNSSELLDGVARSLGAVFRNCRSDEAKVGLVKLVSGAFSRFGQQSVDVAASVVLTQLCGTAHAGSAVCEALLSSTLLAGLSKQLRASPSDEVRSKIATALGNASAFVLSSTSSPAALALVSDNLVWALTDKKSTDAIKEERETSFEHKCKQEND